MLQCSMRAPDPRRFHIFERVDMANLLHRLSMRRDEQAFRELFETYGPKVKSYMMRHGADPHVAEDLAQETMLVVWRKAALYSEGKGSATTWIFTIARNLRIDRLRRERPFQALPEGHDEEPSDEPLPDERLTEREREVEARTALDTLPPEQLEVVRLAYIEGLSHAEIAARLDLPLGTVKSRMRLAYQKIRDSVGGGR
jgi:RNA polymerase sigma-70 factor (ECF subfamily)